MIYIYIYIYIYLLAGMPGFARAGFRTTLAIVLPSLTLSPSALIHRRIDKRTDHKKQHLLIVVAKHQTQNSRNAYCRFPSKAAAQQQESSSNFSKNVNGPGTNRTTLGRSVTILQRSTDIKISYRQKNKVPMGSARFPLVRLGSAMFG
jgi:hypothetical protein